MVIPDLSKTKQGRNTLQSLLDDIDSKLYHMSKIVYSHISFGIDERVDYNCLEDLLTYREILLNKIKGCNCYNAFPISLIVSKIKKLVQ